MVLGHAIKFWVKIGRDSNHGPTALQKTHRMSTIATTACFQVQILNRITYTITAWRPLLSADFQQKIDYS